MRTREREREREKLSEREKKAVIIFFLLRFHNIRSKLIKNDMLEL